MLNAGGAAVQGQQPVATVHSMIQQPVAAVHYDSYMAFFCLRLACIMTILSANQSLGKVESMRWRAMSSNPYFIVSSDPVIHESMSMFFQYPQSSSHWRIHISLRIV
jgi:hypothetical protein